jgi:hypothetical protein
MHGSIEIAKLIQEERRQYSQAERLARLAASVRACCSPGRLERIARAIRRLPAASA